VLSDRRLHLSVSGQAVEKDGVAIILSDIGYSVMLNTIRNVIKLIRPKTPTPPKNNGMKIRSESRVPKADA
jgi:hypothetical protein